jgi:hypothetical protein
MALASNELRIRRFPRLRAIALAIAIALAAPLIVSALPSAAAAQEGGGGVNAPGGLKDSSPQLRPMMISAFTGIGFGHYAGLGFPFLIGGRFYLPIVHNGFIPSLNDEFGLEFGLDFNFVFLDDRYVNNDLLVALGVPAEAMYDFHITPTFDAYVKVGFIVTAGLNDVDDVVYLNLVSSVGLRYEVTPGLLLRAEVGWPWVKAGIGITL